ncbi:hypothetical protein Tco_0283886, partial [Tanacetum coccineum]
MTFRKELDALALKHLGPVPTIVATSTTEAEYVAAANCCGQVLWVQNQLLDYGFNFMNTKIHIDNENSLVKQFWQSAIASTKEDGFFEISATIDNIREYGPNRSTLPPSPSPTSPPLPPPATKPTTDEYLYEKHSPVHHHFSPSQEQAP